MNISGSKYLVSKNIDIWGLSLASLICFFLLKIINDVSLSYLIIVLVISVVLDNGHIYMTYSRVFKEYKKEKMFFIVVPFVIFTFFFIWLFNDIPYFWSFVLYATFFHFARQIYGINRWYMKKEEMNSKFRDFIIYSIIILPILSMHFNPYFTVIFFTPSDFYTYKSELLYSLTININILIVFIWVLIELINYNRIKTINLYRIIFILSNIVLFSAVGYFASNSIEVIIPVMMAHGFQYLVLSVKAENQLHDISVKKVALILLLLATLFGGLDTYLQDLFDMDNSYLYDYSMIDKVLLSLLLVPLFSHYIYDMRIWKRSYFKKIEEKEKC